MLSKIRYVAKNKDKQYWGSGMNCPTSDLWKAQRFPNQEYYDLWLENALYKPKDAENYTLIAIKQMIEEVEENE